MKTPLFLISHFHWQFDISAITSSRRRRGSRWLLHGWRKLRGNFYRRLNRWFNRGFNFRYISRRFNLRLNLLRFWLGFWLRFDRRYLRWWRTLFNNRSYLVIFCRRRV